MSEILDFPMLIAIVVAIVVLLRLRATLGTRTGNERRPPEPRSNESQRTVTDDNKVVELKPRGVEPPANMDAERRALKVQAEIEQFARGNKEVADGLAGIVAADPGFTPKSFIEGAKSAYEMIVTAFAAGDRKTLRNLLEKDVYEGFEAAIIEREAEGHTVDFTFVGLPGVEISEAEQDKKLSQISVRFNAEVVSATRDKTGQLVEGNGDQVVTISDEWTFARNAKSRDPNWKLVATNQLD